MRKNMSFFFIVFSPFFREKSTKNHAKRVKTILVHKNRQKITFGSSFFGKKSSFSDFWGSPRVPRGVSGRPGKFTKSFIFLIHGELRLKTRVDGIREASGRPRRSPQAPSGYDFASIFGSILHVKNKRKTARSVLKNSKNIKELERTVTLIRATEDS